MNKQVLYCIVLYDVKTPAFVFVVAMTKAPPILGLQACEKLRLLKKRIALQSSQNKKSLQQMQLLCLYPWPHKERRFGRIPWCVHRLGQVWSVPHNRWRLTRRRLCHTTSTLSPTRGCKIVWKGNWTKWNMTGSLLRLRDKPTDWVNSLVIEEKKRLQPPFVFRSEGLKQCYQKGTFPDPTLISLERRNISQSWTKKTLTGKCPWTKRALTQYAPSVPLLADTASYVCHLESALRLRCWRREYIKCSEICKV